MLQSGEGEDSSSDAGASDTEGEPRAKQEPLDYDDAAAMAPTNGALPHNFPGLLNLPGMPPSFLTHHITPSYSRLTDRILLTGFPGLPGPSGIPDNFGEY